MWVESLQHSGSSGKHGVRGLAEVSRDEDGKRYHGLGGQSNTFPCRPPLGGGHIHGVHRAPAPASSRSVVFLLHSKPEASVISSPILQVVNEAQRPPKFLPAPTFLDLMTLPGRDTWRPSVTLARETTISVLALALESSAGSPSPLQEEATELRDQGDISSL